MRLEWIFQFEVVRVVFFFNEDLLKNCAIHPDMLCLTLKSWQGWLVIWKGREGWGGENGLVSPGMAKSTPPRLAICRRRELCSLESSSGRQAHKWAAWGTEPQKERNTGFIKSCHCFQQSSCSWPQRIRRYWWIYRSECPEIGAVLTLMLWAIQ